MSRLPVYTTACEAADRKPRGFETIPVLEETLGEEAAHCCCLMTFMFNLDFFLDDLVSLSDHNFTVQHKQTQLRETELK